MDLKKAERLILNHNQKIEDERLKMENEKRETEKKLKKEIRNLLPRITQIIEIGNLCLKNNIEIGQTPSQKRYSYENNIFETDGIHHQLGFYRRRYPSWKYPNDSYDCIGYMMGGACGDKDFITNGDFIFNIEHKKPSIIKNDLSIRHMKKFLNEFETFESEFYKFIENL